MEWTAHGSRGGSDSGTAPSDAGLPGPRPQKMLPGSPVYSRHTAGHLSQQVPSHGPIIMTSVQSVLRNLFLNTCDFLTGGGCGQEWEKDSRQEEGGVQDEER